MNVFPAGEGLPLAPSVCFICEGSPLTGAIDTLRTFQTHVPTKLTGRKYVCIECAKELGRLAGLADGYKLHEAQSVIDELKDELAQADLRVKELEALNVDVLERLVKEAIQKAKPAPRKQAEPKGITAS